MISMLGLSMALLVTKGAHPHVETNAGRRVLRRAINSGKTDSAP